MVSRTVRIFAGVVLLSLSTQGASADTRPPPTATEVAEARSFFEAGLEFHKQHRFEEALAAFAEANRRVPRPSTQRNIAQTYRDMNDMAAAYNAYEALLAAHGDTLKPSERAEIDRALAELAIVTGIVSINVPEANAMVSVDGKDVGLAPRAIRLNVGTHTVAVTKLEFERLERKITVAGHDVFSVDGPLTPLLRTGHLSVVVAPAESDVRIFIDDRPIGLAPWEGDVRLGWHRVSARSTELESSVAVAEITGKDTVVVRLPLHRSQGALRVRAEPLDAEIAIDGVLVGRTSFDGLVTRGKHRLVVSKANYGSYQHTVDVQGPEAITENVVLQRDQPSPSEPAPANTRTWEGIYARLDFLGLFPTTQANSIHSGAVYGPSSSGDIGVTAGGGLGFRMGYSFGVFGIEGIANATYDYASITVNDPTLIGTSDVFGAAVKTKGRTDDWFFHRAGGTFAVGGRFMGETILRPTVGAAFGFSPKSVWFRREVRNGTTANTSDSTVYVAPTFLFDAGIELGSRNNTRCFIGFIAHLDLPRPQTLDASSATSGVDPLATGSMIRVATGPELFLGPVIGFRFGH